ncbi:uncharacterized protein EI90DRAFT_2496567 [Cantharellus anzutake]|uniref:uncharacterized protein n=1 Tax=Cantharellus anzutake TaxID=1750568 RepID=UPI0019036CE2|nr:uncharacterized protein EI90DRAFT_2495693 [Cantharellus anzutake]XP_038910727.1 uncharacterized protein EI90DRAFT_2496567 [Cantharellus anzutake]KAF8321880.1 hypothetical protein EI90DRAFT_2495693 [Cantharellus anzutake]KAF8321889.1 hypothetical protein EI90DRAFT_2496567 [Cantharellus anzutake]
MLNSLFIGCFEYGFGRLVSRSRCRLRCHERIVPHGATFSDGVIVILLSAIDWTADYLLNQVPLFACCRDYDGLRVNTLVCGIYFRCLLNFSITWAGLPCLDGPSDVRWSWGQALVWSFCSTPGLIIIPSTRRNGQYAFGGFCLSCREVSLDSYFSVGRPPCR